MRKNPYEDPYEEMCTFAESRAVATLAIGVRPAAAQLGGITGALNKAVTVKKVADLKVTDAEERQIGQQVSDKMVEAFGVYQDAGVTKYVTLVGAVLALPSPRPGSTGNSSFSTPKASTRLRPQAASSTLPRACSG